MADTSEEVLSDGSCFSDNDCSNGLVCDGAERCIDGECIPGEPSDCDDSDPCTTDICDEDEGYCVHEPIDFDGDGYINHVCSGTDCDDQDRTNYPGADNDGDSFADERCGGDDCDDFDPMIHPGANRDCTGDGDFNCNGTPDKEEGYEKIGDDLRLTEAPGDSLWPSVIWTGTQFGVAWCDSRDGVWRNEIYFVLVSIDGEIVGSDNSRFTNAPGYCRPPFLLWTGSEFGLVWADNRTDQFELYFSRISGDGRKIENDTRVTDGLGNSSGPSLVWTGMEYGLAWNDDRDGIMQIYFARLSNNGTKTESDIKITDTAEGSSSPSLSWTGSEFGLSWHGIGDIFFTRLSNDGVIIENIVRLTSDAGNSSYPSLVWSGSEFGLAWNDDRDSPFEFEIYFTLLSPSGSIMDNDVRITSAGGRSMSPSLVWTGTEFGLAWQDERDGSSEIYFATISNDGTKIGSDMRITHFSENYENPSLVWTGQVYGIAWNGESDGNAELYFARVGCE